VRQLIEATVAQSPGVRVEIRRLLLAAGAEAADRQRAAGAGAAAAWPGGVRRAHPTSGTPLYTDVRLYGAHGVAAVIYGAGPRTVLESNAKRADEHLVLDDLRRATQVVARTLPTCWLPDQGAQGIRLVLVQAPSGAVHGTCTIPDI
jgi:succinyl-diaminopimelate desuccinylase